MANLGYVSTFNINGNELFLKDAALTEIVNEIIEAIGANNGDISDRINNLHERSFDALIKILSQNESEIASIQDGMYKLQYVTITGEGDNAVETLNNSAILIQKGTNQYLYKDGQISSRTKIDSTWENWITFEGGVTSVNGNTGDVIVPGFDDIIKINQNKNYSIGDILWSDMKVTSTVRPITDNVIPIGIIISDSTGMHSEMSSELEEYERIYGWRVMGLKYMTSNGPSTSMSNISWGPTNNSVSGISYYNNGLDNTISICNTNNPSSYPAAYQCQQYSTIGTTAGSWYLGSLAELVPLHLYEYNEIINSQLSALQTNYSSYCMSSLANCGYWTSNEATSDYAEAANYFDNETGDTCVQKNDTNTCCAIPIMDLESEIEISNIQDGIYKLQYVTITGSGDNTDETLNQSAILIQWTNENNNIVNQNLYSRSRITSTRIKRNNIWSKWSIGGDGFNLVVKRNGSPIAQGKFYEYIYNNIPKELYGIWSQFGLIVEFEQTGETDFSIDIHTNDWLVYISTSMSIETDSETGDSRIVVGEVDSNRSQHHSLYNSLTTFTSIDVKIYNVICAKIREIFENLNTEVYYAISYESDFQDYIENNNIPISVNEQQTIVTSVNGQTGDVIINVGVTSFNGATGVITYSAPVTSVNGQTGAVTINVGVTSFNGATGAITYSAPITSVNGQTGAVVTSLSSNYATATGTNSALVLAAGDTYETAFGKLEKAITDNESVTSTAIDDLDDRLTELTNGVGDKNIIESISLNSITQTIYNKNVNIVETKLSKGTTTGAGNAVTDISVSNHQITLVKGATYATQSDINTSIANLVDSAPETLNTLNELAAALGDDPNFATTIATQIGQKYTKPSLGIPGSDLAEDAIPVTSVNGQTGAVTIDTGVTSFNGATGVVTYTAPVTSVNGMTGAVTIQGNIKPDWDATVGSDAEILNKPDLSNFLTIETQSNWNETNTLSAAYIQNKPTIVTSVNGMTGAVTINHPVTSVNGMTGVVTINHPVTSVNGMTGAVTITIPTTSTGVTANDNNPVSGGAVYNKFADLIGAAPAALDTLAEIADALNNDADLAGTLTTQISNKVPKVSNPTADNFASFNSDGTIKDSGHSHSDYITSIKTVNNESLVGTGNIVISGLPLVSAADNGKILMVVNGQWQLVSPSTLYSGSGVPNNANGNNGDLYMQTD